jgi:pimeloyl-ACP methyl ester carboxylesterase
MNRPPRKKSAINSQLPSAPRHRFVPVGDGVRIYTRYLPGKPGAIPLVLHDGLGCDGYVWRSLVQWFKGRHPILHWQYRGHGKSTVPPKIESLSLQDVIQDLDTVLDDYQMDSAIHVGHSMGVQVALEAYRHLSHRIAGLILMCGSYEYPIESWHGAAERNAPPNLSNLFMRLIFPSLTRAFLDRSHIAQPIWSFLLTLPAAYQIAVRTEVNGKRLAFQDFGPYMKHLAQMDVRVFSQFARILASHSAADLLPKIDAPVLIIGAGKDTFTPLWQSTEMHQLIPVSDLLILHEGTHSAPLEHTTEVNQAVDKFIGEYFFTGRGETSDA